ncbi:MAG: formate--tetrahydrofolate ligase [Fimbriimonadales bacterium]
MNNLEIAQSAKLRPIEQIAESAGLSSRDILPYGRSMAKLTNEAIEYARSRPQGKLILVTAITPTPAGEGKTTTTIGLAQGLQKLGHSAIPATREPALGPIFGIKGGACGGGYSQVLPMEEINLFFTGDFPAVSAAHNLLAAMLDAHVHNGNSLGIDVRSVFWPRTVDMNDRALREIVVGLGGRSNGFPRSDGFVVTPASEVMATLCLSRSLEELKRRLGCIIVAERTDRSPVTAADLQANGAMAALLRDAIKPNLVQTIEGGPAFVHGGPFGNIAHGCSSIIATECGLGLADYVVTEAGFGSDLGGEKFLNIVCRQLGRGPDAIVLVATVRALKHHGGSADLKGLEAGLGNLFRHIAHLRHYGPPILVAVNRFPSDTPEEFALIRDACSSVGVKAVWADPYGRGGEGCLELAEQVAAMAAEPSEFRHLYPADIPLDKMIETIARKVYGASAVTIDLPAQRRLKWATEYRCSLDMLVCIAKTQYSFSQDPKLLNAPEDFEIEIREARPSAGAGFVVALAGDIMLMPGLGKEPNAVKIDVDGSGRLSGLF